MDAKRLLVRNHGISFGYRWFASEVLLHALKDIIPDSKISQNKKRDGLKMNMDARRFFKSKECELYISFLNLNQDAVMQRVEEKIKGEM